jgi:HEAT repeat protein
MKLDRSGVTDLRAEAVDCDIDAAGAPLLWLDNVRPDDSVAWLTTLVRDTGVRSSRLADRALTALALHASAAASPVLVDLARSGSTAQLKGRALFWLAQRAVEEALPTITSAIDTDPDTEVKKQAVFALSRLPKDEGVPRLIDLARTHRNPEVRRQAFFWLGQSQDQRAVDFFASILK